MPLASRLAFVTACVIIAVTAACGSDSTSPGDGGTPPPNLTKHFDSLYVTAKAKSTRFAIVVRFSRSRRRYERQGLLVEPQALSDVQRELEAQRRGDPTG